VDVSPRTLSDPDPGSDPGAGAPGARPSTRRWRGLVLGAVVVAVLGFVLFRGLGSATLFFYNVDEAVAKQDTLGTSRFRLQGSVVDGTIARDDGTATFAVAHGGVETTVEHRGEVPKLFQPGIPVVLEGRWQDGVFASDRMLVKHDEVYIEDNPGRVEDYGETSGRPVTP
jgi:cytochrome c-type biogenesis protein CcmE